MLGLRWWREKKRSKIFNKAFDKLFDELLAEKHQDNRTQEQKDKEILEILEKFKEEYISDDFDENDPEKYRMICKF